MIDKFHVQRMANLALETYRKAFRQGLTVKARKTLMHDRHTLLSRPWKLDATQRLKLDTWTMNFPTLGKAYELKEAFYDLWESETAQEAWTRYEAWEQGIPPELSGAFGDLTKAVRNWKTEIFAYFEHPFTNAATESLNAKIKHTNREGRGYSFEVLRAKSLYGTPKTRPRYGQEWRLLEAIQRDEPIPLMEFMTNALDALVHMEGGQTAMCIEDEDSD